MMQHDTHLVRSKLFSVFLIIAAVDAVRDDSLDWSDSISKALKSDAEWPSLEEVLKQIVKENGCAVTEALNDYPVLSRLMPTNGRPCDSSWRERVFEGYKAAHSGELHSPKFLTKYLKEGVLVPCTTPECERPTQAMGEVDGDSLQLGIFVLGPSASGKTTSARFLLEQLVSRNNWKVRATPRFLTIDGGKIRDLSEVWRELIRLPELVKQKQWIGIKNAYDMMKQIQVDFKNDMLTQATLNKWNMLVVTTAADSTCAVLQTGCTEWSLYESLAREGYKLTFLTLVVDLANVEAQGYARERQEGKKYSSFAYTFAYKAACNIMSWARTWSDGPANTNVFAFYYNNNNPGLKRVWQDNCRMGKTEFMPVLRESSIYFDGEDGSSSFYKSYDYKSSNGRMEMGGETPFFMFGMLPFDQECLPDECPFQPRAVEPLPARCP